MKESADNQPVAKRKKKHKKKRRYRRTAANPESIGNRMVQAMLDRAMGIPNEDVEYLLLY